MPTGYEVDMYRNIERIANALEGIEATLAKGAADFDEVVVGAVARTVANREAPEAAPEWAPEWLEFDEAAEAIASVMLRFDHYVSNEQGSCDTGSMQTMLTEAADRYDHKVDEEG